jgi:hypothetical protein
MKDAKISCDIDPPDAKVSTRATAIFGQCRSTKSTVAILISGIYCIKFPRAWMTIPVAQKPSQAKLRGWL